MCENLKSSMICLCPMSLNIVDAVIKPLVYILNNCNV